MSAFNSLIYYRNRYQDDRIYANTAEKLLLIKNCIFKKQIFFPFI